MKFMRIRILVGVITMMQTLNKVLNGISSEKVCKLEFNCIDEAKAFFNMFSKVNSFSIQKDDLKKDKNENIIS